MTDTLRDRIAAALKAVLSEQAYTLTLNDKEPMSMIVDGEVDLLDTADAVIEALGIYEDEMGTGDTRRTRIVSDWEKP